jgi:CheY-like chemotaxis protein
MKPASLLDPRSAPSTASVVLVVEDEPVLRASMVRGLSKLPGIEIVDAGTVRDARELMRAYPPALVISDLDLPDGSGVEVASELERMGRRVPVVFVTAYLGRYRTKVPERPNFEIHEKPLALDRLRRIISGHLGALESESHPFGLVDYVQLAGMGRRSVVIDVRGHLRGIGRVVIRDGELWSASDEQGRGLEAFRRLAFLQNATIACRAAQEAEHVPRDVQGSAESVLLDVLREYDEARHAQRESTVTEIPRPRWPSLQPPPKKDSFGEGEPSSGIRDHDDELGSGWDDVLEEPEAGTGTLEVSAAASFAAIYESALDALLAKRHREAYRHFEAANRLVPDDPVVVANLSRLRAMGFAS